MKKGLMLTVGVFLSASMAMAEEKPMFRCSSEVEGFTAFTVFQNTQVTDVSTTSTLNLKTDAAFHESWVQYGEARVWAGNPIFESQFEKPSAVPGLPADRIYISINQNGTGAISVWGGLDPINCLKMY